MFILGLLVVVIGGSLLLFALRAPQLKGAGRYQLFSREVMLAGNNVFLSAACLVVLLGTLLPLVHKELGLGSISIGAPFFNQMFSYLIVPFVLLMGIGPLSRWKNQQPSALYKQLLLAFGLSLSAAVLVTANFEQTSYMAALGMVMGFWIVVTTIMEIHQRINADKKLSQQPIFSALRKLTPSHWGMVVGHLGFAVSIMGITLVSNYNQEKHVRMAYGETVQLMGYDFTFNGVSNVKGPNYTGYQAHVVAKQDGEVVANLEAEKRIYTVQRNVMTEAGIDSNIHRDLFVALGEQLDDGDWALRIYVKPFVNWIWAGAFIMGFGGILSISDKRYRMQAMASKKAVKNKAKMNSVEASASQDAVESQ